ncbi:uncharacterized protein LOC121745857 [Salvia splendens]|uniref:uncharacterized protein LOC121745857 n=1 Tax=Salvia splendens TaxID=180675 RepID=UPI001C268505|nr:uncharacterized protein LOC121745857 [Salvia splendens]
MGKKAFATKIKPPSSRREENPGTQPSPNPQPSAPTQQAPPMISLDAMAEFLRLQDPTRNWAAELANFSQIRGQGNITAPSEIPPAPVSHAEEQSEEGSSSATAPSETSVPYSAELDAVAAYYDSDPEERKKRTSQEETTHEGSGETERTPTMETVRQERVRKEIDLNESAQKRSLMTDTEFESIVEEVNRREDTALMAEGLDLASRSVGGVEKAVTGTTPEGHTSQSVEGKEEVHEEEKEPEPVDP